MFKERSILLLSIILFLGSCGSASYEVDLNLSEENYINDTVKDGLVKYYYTNNILKAEVMYSNNKKNGWNKYYREDGTLEVKSHYKNDFPNGFNYVYYEDGVTLKVKSFWIDSKQFGDSEWYRKNGEIERFNSMDYLGVFFLLSNGMKMETKQKMMVLSLVLNYTSV